MRDDRPTSVVLATNDSPRCRRAIVRAALLFPDARLVATVVVPDGMARQRTAAAEMTGPDLVPPLWGGSHPRSQARGQLQLQTAAEALTNVCHALGPRARGVVLDGDPARALIRLATAERADVIVVGSLRRARCSVLRRSLADELIASAPCPVIDLGR